MPATPTSAHAPRLPAMARLAGAVLLLAAVCCPDHALGAVPRATGVGSATAPAALSPQTRRRQDDRKQQHTHKYERSTIKVWVPPVTKEVVVGRDDKGRPITKTVVVKPGRYDSRVQLRCRCGSVKG